MHLPPMVMVTVVLATLMATTTGKTLKFQPAKYKDHRGKFINCGDPSHNFTFEWTPYGIVFGEPIFVYADFTPPTNFSSGQACALVHVPHIDDPIYDNCDQVSCENFHQYVQDYCPFQKGKNIKIEGYPITIDPGVTVSAGDFYIHFTVQNDIGEAFICGNGTVHVSDPPPPTLVKHDNRI